jgi:hypothetical protein
LNRESQRRAAAYVHTVPDIDAYNLTTDANDLTMTTANANVIAGNDVDSIYGIRAYQATTTRSSVT